MREIRIEDIPFHDFTTATDIAADLRLVRLVNGFSQSKLAELSGAMRHDIDNWEAARGLSVSVNLFRAFEACGARVRIYPGSSLKRLLSGGV